MGLNSSLADRLIDSGAQPERTALAWARTASSIIFVSLIIFRLLLDAELRVHAFLMGGLLMLTSVIPLLIGRVRARSATQNWKSTELAPFHSARLLSLTISLLGLFVATATILGVR